MVVIVLDEFVMKVLEIFRNGKYAKFYNYWKIQEKLVLISYIFLDWGVNCYIVVIDLEPQMVKRNYHKTMNGRHKLEKSMNDKGL